MNKNICQTEYRENPINKKRKSVCSILFIVLSFVLLSSLILICCLRYNAWFDNIPEESYELPSHIDRITLTPGEDFMRERTISWRYDTLKHESKVEYYRFDSSYVTPEYLTSVALGKDVRTRAGHAYYYHAGLSDLEQGGDYRYRIVSGDEVTEWKNFKMPFTKDTISFIYIGDVQDPDGATSDSLFGLIRDKVSNYDFIAFGGDQIERPMDKYWNIWYTSLGEWATNTPLVMVAGNHEYIKGINLCLDSRWVPQHNYPENGPENFKGQSYYVDFPLMRMIIIDSNIILWPQAVMQHLNWLKKVLGSAIQPWTVVMFHHGVHSVRDSRINLLMRYLFLPVLEDNHVDLVLQGHDHAYSRITTKQDNDTIPPVFITSSASPKQYRNGFDLIHDRLGSNLYLYQTIQITKQTLKYQSLFFDGTVYDDLIIQQLQGERKEVVDNARGWEEIFLYDSFGHNKKGDKKRDKYFEGIKKRESQLLLKNTDPKFN